MKGQIRMILLIFHLTIRFTEELTWTTKMRTSTCCQGNKHILMWNFSTKDNEKVTELHWFFKNTLVCLESSTNGFLVADLYKGRVERNEEAGILLKNVSFNDEGEYTLYVKLEEEKERNIQEISLTVVEPPPNQCKPIIETKHPKGIISCSTSCEKSPLSLEWIINGTREPVGIGPYFLVDSSWTSEKTFCCLRDFKCHDDDQFKFCTPNHISFTEDTHSVIPSFKDTNHMVIISMLMVILVIAITAVIVFARVKLRRKCRSCHKWHDAENQPTMDHHELEILGHKWHDTENQPTMDHHELETLGHKWHDTENQPTMDHHELETLVLSEPQHLKKHCNEKFEDVHAAAAITDQPLQDSNQHVESVKNISKDTDFLKSMIHLSTALIAELQASKKETTKLKRHITNLGRKQNRYKYSPETTKVK